ncbi:MAG TPA: outer membrane lipoprotein chaperone LolA [Gemmatimonadaceae bacterium]|jgi:outer membrane lipoprotein carrier protein|nr:outer membrane lipoprotein chaperone LolA [Gemmatimonadaceae bacterium]
MHVRRLRSFALVGALLAPLSLASARPRQADLLDRAVAAWAKVKTARASFEQTITNPLTGRTLTSTAEFQQQRPGKLSVRFSAPADEAIVADGTSLWLYLPSSAPGQVIRTSARSGGSGSVDFTAQFLTAPRSKYTVSTAGTLDVGGRATHGFTLVPKEKTGAQFKTATVWIDDADATIRQFEVTESSGLQRKVRLTSFRTNVPVDASAFTFKLPEGVRIVDR